jgi:site-specific DNA recombinase
MNTTQPEPVFTAYSRKSSEDYEDRQVASIESQERELKEVQKRLGIKVLGFKSESKSAHSLGRPIFNQLIEEIQSGITNAILVWHPNRLARNPVDAGWLIHLIDTGKLLEIRTPSRSYRNTPEDKFVLNLEFGLSKKDSDDKSIVVKRGLMNKIQNGWRPGVAPHGYLNDRATESGNRRVLTDPERFEFIKKIFQLKYEGVPVRKIQTIANDEWVFRTRAKKRSASSPLAISTLYAILSNPFYCGKYQYSGEWYEGSHEKAVEPEIFDQIQIMLGSKGMKAKPHTHEFAYTGLIRCGECKGVITAEEKVQIICSICKNKFAITAKNNKECAQCHTLIEDMVSPKILHYTYYHCTKKVNPSCTQRSIEVTPLEEQIKEILDGIEISDCFMEWAITQINEDCEKERDFREDKIQSLRRAHDNCRQQLDNLLKLKISPLNTDGSMLSDDQFKAQKQALEAQLNDLDTQLLEVDDRMVKKAQEAADKFDFSAHAKARFASGDLLTRKDILSTLGSNLNLKDKKLDLQPHPHLTVIKKMKEGATIIGKAFEPGKEGYTKLQLESLYASNPTVLRGQDSNLGPRDYALSYY